MSPRVFFFLTTAIGAALVHGCGPEATFDDVDARLYEATPTYEADIAPLVTRYCVTCHDGRGAVDGGVEMETYEKLYSARIKNACVAIRPELIARYGDDLRPTTPPNDVPCGGETRWEPFSMPAGAKLKMTPSEQVLFVRWVVTGAPER